MLEEIKTKLAEFVKSCEGDEEKEAIAKAYVKDVELYERTAELKKDPHYAGMIAELEEVNAKTQEGVMNANLVRTPTEAILVAIADFQANRRALNSLKGPELEALGKRLDLSLKTLEEEKEA